MMKPSDDTTSSPPCRTRCIDKGENVLVVAVALIGAVLMLLLVRHGSRRPHLSFTASPSENVVIVATSTSTRSSQAAEEPAVSKFDRFRRDCEQAIDSRVAPWPIHAFLSKETFTEGERLFCTRGRQLYREGTASASWPVGRYVETPLRPIDDLNGTLRNISSSVEYHTSVAVLTTTPISMFHMLNDFIVPWPFIARRIFSSRMNATAAHPIDELPLDYILLHVDGALRGYGSENVSVAILRTLLTGPKQTLRTLIDGEKSDADSVTHCYCRAVLQPATALLTYPPGSMIAQGDPARRENMLRFKLRLNSMFNFLPYGTFPVPKTEYAPYHLWPNMPSTVPRLLLLIRRKSRRIGSLTTVVQAAETAGFNVQILAPEEVPVAVQARAARYADVLMGMHGQALTWLTLLDGVRASHCRWVVELCHFGRPFKRIHNVYELLAADSFLSYVRIPAVNVKFDPGVVNPKAERKLLLKKSFPHELVGFNAQTAFHLPTVVSSVLNETFRHVKKCSLKNEPVRVTAAYLTAGEPVYRVQ